MPLVAKTYKPFRGRILMIQGASGEKAVDSLRITSELNRIYCDLHGLEYASFDHRILNETRYTGHWDRYQVSCGATFRVSRSLSL